MKSVLSKLLIVTILFGFISCGGGSTGSTPGDVVKTMIGNLADGSNDDMLAISVNKKGESLSDKEVEFMNAFLPEIKKDMDKKEGIKEVVIMEEVISEDGKTATVSYQILWGNGDKGDKSDTDLILVDGKWRPIFDLGK
jgi:Domain of unknown function (DUF4878)